MMDIVDVVMIVVILLFVAFVVVACIFTVHMVQTKKLCLENGWRNYSITWDLQKFCIREENEYEIVKPLSEILAEK
jgi:hypothetical protein